MIPVPQRIVGARKDKQRGDCYKCCVASILELSYEDVPHFMQGEPNPDLDDFSNLALWLRERDLPFTPQSTTYLSDIEITDPDEFHAFFIYESEPRNWHPGFWIATVKSRVYPNTHHAVVMEDKSVAFDPSPSRNDLGPYEFCGEDVLVPDFGAIARVTFLHAQPSASPCRIA